MEIKVYTLFFIKLKWKNRHNYYINQFESVCNMKYELIQN